MKIIISLIVGAVLGIGSLQIPAVQQMIGKSLAPQMLIEVESPLDFYDTLDKIVENAKAEGWKVPKKWRVNFQRNLEKVTGEDIGPNEVIKMCEPHAAVKMLKHDEFKLLTTMMPCTIAVYEKSNGKTYISMMNMDMLGLMYGGEIAEIAKDLAPQMKKMVTLSK
jgi:uncharacterized protein (DUF302 family)